MTALPPRKDLWIASQNGKAELAAWFYPAPSGQRGPAIVIGHGLGGTRSMRLDVYAETFQKAGYSAIAFDYAGFGDSKGTFPRQVLDFYRQQDDWDAVLKHVRGLELVDPDKVAVFGTSFGGGHVIYLAARDTRIAAAISQCPFTSGFHSALQLGVLPTLKLTPVALADFVRSFFSNASFKVKLAGNPGDTALMNAHDVMEGYHGLLPDGMKVPEAQEVVAARAGLQIPLLFPGAKAKDVKCSLYVSVCTKDTVAPPGPTLAYVKQAPKGEIEEYDCGHFAIYHGEWFDKATKNYISFLERNLPPAAKL